jgi:hypothetical protein
MYDCYLVATLYTMVNERVRRLWSYTAMIAGPIQPDARHMWSTARVRRSSKVLALGSRATTLFDLDTLLRRQSLTNALAQLSFCFPAH